MRFIPVKVRGGSEADVAIAGRYFCLEDTTLPLQADFGNGGFQNLRPGIVVQRDTKVRITLKNRIADIDAFARVIVSDYPFVMPPNYIEPTFTLPFNVTTELVVPGALNAYRVNGRLPRNAANGHNAQVAFTSATLNAWLLTAVRRDIFIANESDTYDLEWQVGSPTAPGVTFMNSGLISRLSSVRLPIADDVRIYNASAGNATMSGAEMLLLI